MIVTPEPLHEMEDRETDEWNFTQISKDSETPPPSRPGVYLDNVGSTNFPHESGTSYFGKLLVGLQRGSTVP